MGKFISSDHHFFHDSLIRPRGMKNHREFDTIEEHNQYIIDVHNSVVDPEDDWYCLGDVFLPGQREFSDINFDLLNEMNGKRKFLITGNHDTSHRVKNAYYNYFDSITSSLTLSRTILLTHIPVHPIELEERFHVNVHGHRHTKSIQNDDRYINTSLEAINFRPLNIEKVYDRIEEIVKL